MDSSVNFNFLQVAQYKYNIFFYEKWTTFAGRKRKIDARVESD